MVRMPTVTRRSEHDENRDGRIDRREEVVPTRRGIADRRQDTVDDHVVEDDHVVAEPALRPRASGLAALGLVLGVLAAAAVATGVLVGPGVVVGLIGVLAAVGGVSATARRHIAGRSEALLGLLLSMAAVVVGLLAITGAISWPDTGTNEVGRLADWVASALPWLDWR